MLALTELGKRLKEARIEKGLSLEDLQKETKIQKRYLAGIEEGNYDLMPGKFYVRAFIKQYCEAVGLNVEQTFEQYQADIPSAQHQVAPEELSRVKTRTKEVAPKNSKVLDALPKAIIAAVVVGVLVLGWVIALYINKDDKEQANSTDSQVESQSEQSSDAQKEDSNDDSEQASTKTDENKEAEKKEAEKKEAAKKEEEKESDKDESKSKLTTVEGAANPGTYKLEGADEFKLELTATATTPSWVGVTNGKGNSFFSSMLQKGKTETIDLTNEQDVKIRVGFAPGVEVKVNGEVVQYPSDPKQNVTQNVFIQYDGSEANSES
ncbi:helix-turn-helix domain-containing protein [Priestia endophytica]|uniref:helix-turn-helix domain-containing protein n=1 Tax=Priestia endophytica TaxID=135735 RepID=UPI0027DE8A5B|nr:RodZ domain-containing protein [Priestia endophytica]